MLLDLPLYAAQRLPSGVWAVRAPVEDPFLPDIIIADVIGDPEEIVVAIDQNAVE